MNYSFNDIYNILRHRVATVTFTKVDGSTRTMTCTLKDDILPEEYRGRGAILTEASNVIRVYELGQNQWRSFKVDSVTSII